MRRFGKYLLERQLAIGGMAEIFLAHQHGPAGFAKQLVIKRIRPHHANDQQFIRMFLAEARTSAKLNHPNLVQIYELGECEGAYYIAMEYIRGESLAKLIRRLREYEIRLPPYIAAKIIATTCDGIDYAHNFCDVDGEPVNLVHRDLSPDNILVSFSGGVKVIDFGIAQARDTGAEDDSGLVKGKFCYMSPEQITGR
ncbi:MAG: serine/threonine-protein kinase, partial [Myxococcota bacterium]|nr:serine/threonine-protein kinase [Myxococcota bacterium]